MAGERVMWLVWNIEPIVGSNRRSGAIFTTEEEASAWRTGCGSNWRCSQITVKETDGE